ncbi:MAG: UDP-N-acetylmuramoyl-L-alanyl-D-glutamate--2,6-diaminopimelate ligase [Candidatus Gastranaerophilales bacterium]|nr:UDP-N-acetylmuramoyl-L-alanyl-D-glutamate--2,6-diaminopimelate ligase [Candidatus Gastranaerophilales bacterium]
MLLDKLTEFLKPDEVINNSENIEIKDISYNSKTTKQGDIFVCLVGEKTDGHKYAKMAQDNGAVAILAQNPIDEITIPTLIVKDTQKTISDLAGILFDYPSKKINLIGITGTNGKTTVTHLIERIFEYNKKSCGLIGTLGYKLNYNDTYKDAKHTTPQAPELQRTLCTMLDNKIDNVVMEVSSHALCQHRVGTCEFDCAVLTNLTQDHLDYHITMQNYFEAKATLFKNLKSGSKAIINNDDKWAEKFKEIVPDDVKILTYGINNDADIKATNLKFDTLGASFDCVTPLGNYKINLLMTGLFSVYNALAALTTAISQNLDINLTIKALEETHGVAGRFEAITKEPLTIVDYAHTPDGLENVLNTARKILPDNGRLICVFGCGGDRDATKRPKMGAIVEKLSDVAIVTSDNPRSEDPQQIITDILSGIKSLSQDKIMVEADRHLAIKLASKISKPDDIVVIAGKGHEDYQILKDKTIHFDDREEVRNSFSKVDLTK